MLTTKLSKLSPELLEEFIELGKALDMEVTTDTRIGFFELENIKNERVRKRAEKLLQQAEKEVGALAAARLHMGETTFTERQPARFRTQSLPPVQAEMLPGMNMRIEESRIKLLEGNGTFRAALNKMGIKPEEVKRYDAILITCSDARCEMTELDQYAGKRILALQVAGNVISDDVREAIKRLELGGEIIVCGHVDCGACKGKRDDPHAKAGLLGRVDIVREGYDIFSANAMNQAQAIMDLPETREKKAKVTALEFDPTKRRGDRIAILGADTMGSRFISTLRFSAGKLVSESLAKGKDLSTQTAHAIAISDPLDLGRFTDARIIFGAGQNEIFGVSAVGGRLGEEALGSIEYALGHVHGLEEDAHIVILNTNTEIAKEIERTIIKRLGRKATITVMQYDRESGEARVA